MDIKTAIERRADIRCDNKEELAQIFTLLSENGIGNGLVATNKQYPKYVCICEDGLGVQLSYNAINNPMGVFPILCAEEVIKASESITAVPNVPKEPTETLNNIVGLTAEDMLKEPVNRVMIDESSEITETDFVKLLSRRMRNDLKLMDDFTHDCIMRSASTSPGSGFFGKIMQYGGSTTTDPTNDSFIQLMQKSVQDGTENPEDFMYTGPSICNEIKRYLTNTTPFPPTALQLANALGSCIARDLETLQTLQTLENSIGTITAAQALRSRLREDVGTLVNLVDSIVLNVVGN